MNYKNIELLTQDFMSGEFIPGEQHLTLEDTEYSYHTSSNCDWKSCLFDNEVPPSMTYKANGDSENNKVVEFVWKSYQNTILPHHTSFCDIKSSDEADDKTGDKTGDEHVLDFNVKVGVTEESDNDNIIGDVVSLKIANLPASSALKGKVDTGATVCSLHADSWTIANDIIKFKCPALSENTIATRLIDKQSVKSADGGVEYRPVVQFKVIVNEKNLGDIQFNLNDRSQMDYPVLVGQNLLEKGKFLIDPNVNETVDPTNTDTTDNSEQ